MPHHRKEKEKFKRVNGHQGTEEEIKTGQRQAGQPAEKAIGGQGNSQHLGGEEEARFEFPVSGV